MGVTRNRPCASPPSFCWPTISHSKYHDENRVNLKISRKVRLLVESFCPNFDILKSARVVSGPSALVKWTGSVGFGPKDGYIELYFTMNFKDIRVDALSKVWEYVHLNVSFFWSKSNASLHLIKIEGSNITWTLLKHHKRSMMRQNPLPKLYSFF